MRARLLFWMAVGASVLFGCTPPQPTGAERARPTQSSSGSEPSSRAPPGPAPYPSEKSDSASAPWHRISPQPRECVRDSNARWSSVSDPSDADGWRHFLVRTTGDGAERRVNIVAPTGMAIRPDGSVVVLDLEDHITVVDPDCTIRWRAPYPRCGALAQIAIGKDGAITFGCGYSVIRFDPDGKLEWQKAPFGNLHVGGPSVDARGTLYISGGDQVAALRPSGEIQWTLSTGNNRAVSAIAWNTAGNLVFDTSMAGSHSEPDESGTYFYFDDEPNELFEVTPDGEVVNRVEYKSAPPPGGWPVVLPTPEDGAHRVE